MEHFCVSLMPSAVRCCWSVSAWHLTKPKLDLTYLLWPWTVWWHLSLFAVEGEQRHRFSLFLKWLSFDKVTGSSSCVCGEHDQPDMYSLWQLVLFKVWLIQTFPFGCQRTTSSELFFVLLSLSVILVPALVWPRSAFALCSNCRLMWTNWIFWGPYVTFSWQTELYW